MREGGGERGFNGFQEEVVVEFLAVLQERVGRECGGVGGGKEGVERVTCRPHFLLLSPLCSTVLKPNLKMRKR